MRMRALTIFMSIFATGAAAQATAPHASLRPEARPFVSTQGTAVRAPLDVKGAAGFADWVRDFRSRALARCGSVGSRLRVAGLQPAHTFMVSRKDHFGEIQED